MGALIDSTALVALQRGRAGLDGTLDPAEPVALAAPTAAELLAAVARSPDAETATQRTSFLERLLERLDVVPFDGLAARVRAQLDAAQAPSVDERALDVAAIAISMGWKVVACNGRYDRIPGLNVVRIEAPQEPRSQWYAQTTTT